MIAAWLPSVQRGAGAFRDAANPAAPGGRATTRLDMTTLGCHTGGMTEKKRDAAAYRETFERLREVRDQAVQHMRLAQQFHAERRDILRGLISEGFSQAEIARELGVTRQAIQKMLAG